MRYYRRTYRFNAEGTRAMKGQFVAEDILHARFKVEDRLGYKKPLDWHYEDNRHFACAHGTRVVVVRINSDEYCPACGKWDAPKECCMTLEEAYAARYIYPKPA